MKERLKKLFTNVWNVPNALTMLRGMIFERKAADAMLTQVKTKEKFVKPQELFTPAKPK